jgi:tetratricopeptide (TPR) repeat protein
MRSPSTDRGNQPQRNATLLFVIAVVQLFLLSPCCAGQNAPAIEARLRDLALAAKQAQARHDFRGAIHAYEEILRIRPDLAECWANLGLMHQFLGEYGQANQDFEVALDKNPALYVPNLVLGLNLLRAHKAGAAIHLLERAEKVRPEDEQIAMGLGRGEQSLGDYAKASYWFHHATVISPGDSAAWYALGVAYLYLQNSAVVQLRRLDLASVYARALVADAFADQGHWNDAIRIYKTLSTASTQPPFLLSALGFAYCRRGSLALSRDIFEKQIQKAPACLPARFGLAHIAAAKGQFAESLNQLGFIWHCDRRFFTSNLKDLVNGLDPQQTARFEIWLKQRSSQDPYARVASLTADHIQNIVEGRSPAPIPAKTPAAEEWAKALSVNDGVRGERPGPLDLWRQGHYTSCEAILKQRESYLPASALDLLAQCSYYAEDFRSTLDASQSILRLDSRSGAALYWQAKSSEELSTEALARASSLAPESPRVHLLLAQLYRETQQLASAEREYATVLAIEPNNAAAHLGLANVDDLEFRFDRAKAQLGSVFRSDPGNLEASFLMGKILTEAHQYAEAIPYLRTSLHGQPLLAPEAHSLLARCYSTQGRVLDAIGELRSALPEDTTGTFHYQLYLLYEKAGDRNAAAAALRESEALRKRDVQQQQELIGSINSNP